MEEDGQTQMLTNTSTRPRQIISLLWWVALARKMTVRRKATNGRPHGKDDIAGLQRYEENRGSPSSLAAVDLAHRMSFLD
jgi:hypothetical protein